MNAIGHETRRGKGNILICSADVASALSRLVFLTTPPHLLVTATCSPTTTAAPSQVLLTVVLRSTSILTLLTFLTVTSMWQVTKVAVHMTQVSSTALTCLCRWFAPLVRTPSSRRSTRPDTVSLLTPSLRVLPKAVVHSPLTLTVTTDVFWLTTLCDPLVIYSTHKDPSGSFFCVNK